MAVFHIHSTKNKRQLNMIPRPFQISQHTLRSRCPNEFSQVCNMLSSWLHRTETATTGKVTRACSELHRCSACILLHTRAVHQSRPDRPSPKPAVCTRRLAFPKTIPSPTPSRCTQAAPPPLVPLRTGRLACSELPGGGKTVIRGRIVRLFTIGGEGAAAVRHVYYYIR